MSLSPQKTLKRSSNHKGPQNTLSYTIIHFGNTFAYTFIPFLTHFTHFCTLPYTLECNFIHLDTLSYTFGYTFTHPCTLRYTSYTFIHSHTLLSAHSFSVAPCHTLSYTLGSTFIYFRSLPQIFRYSFMHNDNNDNTNDNNDNNWRASYRLEYLQDHVIQNFIHHPTTSFIFEK